mmetsp:Transcript_644/g.1540  ORF Transcript_644/g.1540 Transcript_644/m.1540 type:complete len:277 (-) Transcript_644:125-955(-)
MVGSSVEVRQVALVSSPQAIKKPVEGTMVRESLPRRFLWEGLHLWLRQALRKSFEELPGYNPGGVRPNEAAANEEGARLLRGVPKSSDAGLANAHVRQLLLDVTLVCREIYCTDRLRGLAHTVMLLVLIISGCSSIVRLHRPRQRIVAVGRLVDMVDLASDSSVVPPFLEELRQGLPLVTDPFLAKVVYEVPYSRCVWQPARHEAISARSTEGIVRVRPCEGEALLCQLIDVWSVPQVYSVSSKAGSQVISHEEKHIPAWLGDSVELRNRCDGTKS